MSRLHADGISQPIGGGGFAVPYTPVCSYAGSTIGTTSGAVLKLPGVLFVWALFAVTAVPSAGAVSISVPGAYTAAFTGAGVGVLSLSTVSTYALELTVAAGTITAMTATTSTASIVGTYYIAAMIPTTT